MVTTRGALYQHFEQYALELPPEQRPAWLVRTRALLDQLDEEMYDYLDAAHNEAKAGLDYFVREWAESIEQNPAPVPAVSNYGKSNIDEAFAEAFMHYVLELDMTQDQAESFRAALKYASGGPPRPAPRLSP
jgi:hypothetical protein